MQAKDIPPPPEYALARKFMEISGIRLKRISKPKTGGKFLKRGADIS